MATAPKPAPPPVADYRATLTVIDRLIKDNKLTEAQTKLADIPGETLTDLSMRMSVSTLWNNLGLSQAKAEQTLGAAVTSYKTALTINPNNRTAFLNLVLAYWSSKDPALTNDMIEQAVRLAPDDPMPHLILAERFIQKDDLATATAHLEQARAHTAKSPQAQQFLDAQIAYVERSRTSEQKFQARDSSHFTVKYDGGEDGAVWTRVLEILEDAYRDIGRQLGHYPESPILVVLHTRERFHDATGGPAWSDGLYDPMLGRIKIPTQGALTDQAWLTRVLRHEYVHALLHDRLKGRRIPQWLNEGLAMQLAGDPPPDIPALVRGQMTLINLAYLEGPWGGLNPHQAQIAYLEGNSATRYLMDRFGMGIVRDLMDQLAKGDPFATAFKDRVYISYEEFQRRWVENLNQMVQNGRT